MTISGMKLSKMIYKPVWLEYEPKGQKGGSTEFDFRVRVVSRKSKIEFGHQIHSKSSGGRRVTEGEVDTQYS